METTIQSRSRTDGPPEPAWCLTVVHHPSSAHLGVRALVLRDEELGFGRHGDALGPRGLDDNRLSRRHARFRVDSDDQLRLIDDGSTNGTRVNGQAVLDQRLSAGDVIELGSILLLVTRVPARYAVPHHVRWIGRSYPSATLLSDVERVARHPTTVLLTGETGVGKELVAGIVHDDSGRDGPLVPIDCGALPDRALHTELFGSEAATGLIARAHRGTLFLDSIGDASPALQAALLRFLDGGQLRPLGAAAPIPVDVRVIAARRDGDGADLRDDFLARLTRFVIRVPPLRDRRDDIPALVGHFARAYAGRDIPVQRQFMVALLRYAWPRNVRELEAVIERAWIERNHDQLDLSPALAETLGEAAVSTSPPPWPPDGFLISRSGSWFRPPRSARVAISHRPSLVAIVRALAERHAMTPGEPVALGDLIAAAWPDEKLVGDSGSNRAYVAIATLRKLGLRDAITRDDQGYALAAAAAVTLVD